MRFKHKEPSPIPRRREMSREERRNETPATPSFIRNRTLTGTSSLHVSTTGEANAQLKSPRVHAHHLANQRRRVITLLVAVLFAVLLLYIIVSQFTAHVRVVLHDFPDQNVQSTYENTLQAYFNRHPIERLRMFANTSAMTSFIEATNPEVKALTVEPSSKFATSTIQIIARHPIAGWNTHGQAEYVDENGVAFRRNYYPTPKLQIIDRSNIPIAAGQAIASDTFLGFVGQLVGALHTRGYRVTRVEIPDATTRQVNVRLEHAPYYIKCLVDRSAEEQAEDISRVARYLTKHRVTPRYVDVRVEGKAYYK